MSSKSFFESLGWLAVTSLTLPLAACLFGAAGGWSVGAAFPDTYAAICAHINWPFKPWETGAFLSFVGIHMRTRTQVNAPKAKSAKQEEEQ